MGVLQFFTEGPEDATGYRPAPLSTATAAEKLAMLSPRARLRLMRHMIEVCSDFDPAEYAAFLDVANRKFPTLEART